MVRIHAREIVLRKRQACLGVAGHKDMTHGGWIFTVKTTELFLRGGFFFSVGVLAQSVMLLRAEWRPAPVFKILLYSAASLLFPTGLIWYQAKGLFPLSAAGVYVLLTLTGFSLGLAWSFRDRLLPRMNELTLLSCVITVWYAFLSFVYRGTGTDRLLLAVLLAPTVATVFLAFNPAYLKRGWKVFFFSWYLTLLALLVGWQFSFGRLFSFFTGHFAPAAPSSLLFSGMAYCMGLIYLLYLFMLNPLWVPSGRWHVHYAVERDLFVDLALAGYDERAPLPKAVMFSFLALQAVFFFAVARYGIVSPETAVNIGILLPLVPASVVPPKDAAGAGSETDGAGA